MNTYVNGFLLYVTKDISKREFIYLCNRIGDRFNDFYNSTEYSFSPELITEGGIIFSNFTGSKYKTMRVFRNGTGEISLYGMIPGNVKEIWINDNSSLISNDTFLGTCLKCQYGTPRWTKHELLIFKECFEEFGIMLAGVPMERDLSRMNESEYYLDLFSLLRK